MSDIVYQLRQRTVLNYGQSTGSTPHVYGVKVDPLCERAAAEIEKLRAAAEEARRVLSMPLLMKGDAAVLQALKMLDEVLGKVG